ncbi:MAG TPA: hypothetical protein VHC70_08015, partial [Phycisphaerales bacterium]|nr:hypothetical protein [Phycisphaerales bacterium]
RVFMNYSSFVVEQPGEGVNFVVVDDEGAGREVDLVNSYKRKVRTLPNGLAEDCPARWAREGEHLKVFDAQSQRLVADVVVHLDATGAPEVIRLNFAWRDWDKRCEGVWDPLRHAVGDRWIDWLILSSLPFVIAWLIVRSRRATAGHETADRQVLPLDDGLQLRHVDVWREQGSRSVSKS